MTIIPDNTGTLGEHLETWAIQHMAREVRFQVDQRQRICRLCPRHREHNAKLFVQCGTQLISVAGGKCPLAKW